jgi:CRP-like cAMP-binding protein
MLRQFYYKNGRDVTEQFACERQGVLCIASLFKKENTKLMVEALESGVIYLIPYFKLIELSGQYPLLATLLRKILESSLILSQEKADSWRYETAHERYSRFLKENPVAARQVSINHLASYLLMSPETLSRVRAGELS